MSTELITCNMLIYNNNNGIIITYIYSEYNIYVVSIKI